MVLDFVVIFVVQVVLPQKHERFSLLLRIWGSAAFIYYCQFRSL